MVEKEHDEAWLLNKGWQKHLGIKVNYEAMSSDFDELFIDNEDKKDFITEDVEYYTHPESEEFAGELNDAIERQEMWDEEE